MITVDTLAQKIQTELNANEIGIQFKVFADAGKYEKALKTPLNKRKFTNCMLRMGSSSVVPAQGVTIATQNAMLEVCVQLPTPETDAEVISAHRAVLDGYFGDTAVESITQDDKTYSVAATYALASTGTVEQRPLVGTSLTFYVSISYGYIEKGLNSSNVTFTLDGEPIPYTVATITKTPTIESNAYSNTVGKSTSRGTAFMHVFDIEMPALTDVAISTMVLAGLANNDLGDVHTLAVDIDGIESSYSVIFGASALNVQGVDNGGLMFSLVEAAAFSSEVQNGNV